MEKPRDAIGTILLTVFLPALVGASVGLFVNARQISHDEQARRADRRHEAYVEYLKVTGRHQVDSQRLSNALATGSGPALAKAAAALDSDLDQLLEAVAKLGLNATQEAWDLTEPINNALTRIHEAAHQQGPPDEVRARLGREIGAACTATTRFFKQARSDIGAGRLLPKQRCPSG